MSDATTFLSDLRRPRLLVSAARAGLDRYDRDRDLARVAQIPGLSRAGQIFGILVTEEARAERHRKAGDACYSFARHIDLLVALMAEARRLPPSAGLSG